MEQMERAIARGLAAIGLDAQRAPLLAEYGRRLLEKNQVMNLTAIEDPLDVARLHMLDCAALCAHWDFTGKSLVDVGTGAGFPGMVIAILCPQAAVTLLDPLQKRLDFLGEVAQALGLSNTRLLHARGEDAGRDPALRDTFHFAAARAVADLTVLSELCLPLVRPGGLLLAMKSTASGPELQEAANMVEALGGKALEPYDYPIPDTDITHRVCPILKTRPTPAAYPRRWAKIKPKSDVKNR